MTALTVLYLSETAIPAALCGTDEYSIQSLIPCSLSSFGREAYRERRLRWDRAAAAEEEDEKEEAR